MSDRDAMAWDILRAFRVRARDIGVLGYSPKARRVHQDYRRRQIARRRRRRG